MPSNTAAILAAYPQAGLALASKIVEVSNALGIPDPAMLANVINFETGYTFRSDVRNPYSGATGLIQFMPSTASKLGTSTAYLAALTPVQQMEWVYRYFLPYKGRMQTQEDVYMAVFYPAAMGKGRDYAFSAAVQAQNPGIRTAGDYVNMANARARLTPTTGTILSVVTTAAAGAVATTALSLGALAVVGLLGLGALAAAGVGGGLAARALKRRNSRRRRSRGRRRVRVIGP